MTWRAPANSAPAIAASPTPPQPSTATVSPCCTGAVCTAAPQPAMTPQPSSPTAAGSARSSTLMQAPSPTRVFSANAPSPSAGDSGVPSVSVIGEPWCRLSKHRCGPTAAAGPALPARRAPGEHDAVADGARLVTALPDGLDPAGGLVAEQERELVVDPALAVVQVGVADAAGLDLHDDLARARGRGSRCPRSRRARPWLRATTARTVCGTGVLLRDDAGSAGRYSAGSAARPRAGCRRPAGSSRARQVSSSSGTATRRVVPSACRAALSVNGCGRPARTRIARAGPSGQQHDA